MLSIAIKISDLLN